MSVKFYDHKTKRVTEIHEGQLAPGSFKVKIAGIGECFIGGPPAPYAPLDAKLKEKVRYLESVFRDVYPQSVEEWENGFMRDADPAMAIGAWISMVDNYKYITETLKLENKKDYFDYIRNCANAHKSNQYIETID